MPETEIRQPESPSTDDPSGPSRGDHPAEPIPSGPRRGWFGLLAALALLATGVAIGWLVFGGPAEDSEIPLLAEQTAEVDEPGPGADEPVAAVADALLPAVVQIDTGNGVGSGVIYDSDGLILTAAHVVAGREEVLVRLADGSQETGEVLGGDIPADIAVVQVDASGLPAAPLALEGDLQVGQLAVAIGSPYGLDSTVTSGVVSAINQTVGNGGEFQSLIQTDAAINPGNSGGALANREGEVIGINVSIFSASGGNDGVGFAVPIDVASDLAETIVSGDPVVSPVLGVVGTNAEDGTSGALVTEVEPGSGADEAGIEEGDIIVAVDGVEVRGIGDVVAQIRSHRPEDAVVIELSRGGETIELEATLGGS